MKRSKTISTLILAGTLAVGTAWAAVPMIETSFSVEPPSTAPAKHADCAAMKKMSEEMLASQKAADARLDALVVAMNNAKGDARVDATAAVINDLVKQRGTMRGHMMHMHSSMMEHMMQHLEDAAPPDMQKRMKEAMEGCPMMHDKDSQGDDKDPMGRPRGAGGG